MTATVSDTSTIEVHEHVLTYSKIFHAWTAETGCWVFPPNEFVDLVQSHRGAPMAELVDRLLPEPVSYVGVGFGRSLLERANDYAPDKLITWLGRLRYAPRRPELPSLNGEFRTWRELALAVTRVDEAMCAHFDCSSEAIMLDGKDALITWGT